MATITSTIKLVDQMTPTLNKISKAIDRVNDKSKKIGSAKTWSGFNTGVHTATKSTHSLYYALRRVVFILGTLRGLQGLATITDTMISANARIDNINDGLYKTSDYLTMIYQAAQRSRGSFMGIAQSVGKLGTVAGDAFDSVSEMIAFTELMNKLFVISGASATESSNAMYQLTQAMAAGRLQGDEMRSILENAPLLAQKLADYLGVTKGEIKELGADGVITADIIKNALFGAADEIEKKFNKMPKTIGQVWTEIKNYALNSFRPVIERVQQFINSPIFEKFKNRIFAIIDAISNALLRLFAAFETPRVQTALDKVYTAMQTLWGIVVDVATVVANAAIWIADNWSWLSQIIYGGVAAILLYKAVMLVVAAAHIVSQAAMAVASWVSALIAGQAWAWVILIIIALIATIFLVVAAWNYFTDSTVSATGIILGAVAFVIASIVDLFVFLWDVFLSVCEIGVYLAKLLSRVFVDLLKIGALLIHNCVVFIGNLVSAILGAIVQFGENVVGVFSWIKACAGVFGGNLYQLILNLCSKLPEPFVNFGNKVIDVFNWIIGKFNQMCDFLTFTIPGLTIMGNKLWDDIEVKVLGSGLKELDKIPTTPVGNLTAGMTAMPSIGDYVNWGSVGDAWSDGMDTFDYESFSDYIDASYYDSIWNDLTSSLGNIWDSGQYTNPIDAFKDWYSKGESLENGVAGLVDGIGGLLQGLFGGDGGKTNGNGVGRFDKPLPDSLEDLLGGSSGIPDKLGAIADNTGNSAGSAGNIEDTLDLAEEELELLRKLAEQEVINRFTTAEIHVDMTNNNNISSGMDLDGIVTHLSTKLYEELGVVASGVHY